jgi:hypothetical protein
VTLALAGTAVALILTRDTSSGPATGLQGSGVAAVDSRDLPAFHAIDLAGSNALTVHVGLAQSVVVNGDDNLLDRVATDVRAGKLKVWTRGSFTTDAPMSVNVTVPSLDAISLTGTGSVVVDGARGDKLVVRVPGSGTLSVDGAVKQLDASLGGSGDMELGRLNARDVTAAVTGTGQLFVHASHSLDASVTGVGSIVYSGNPKSVVQHVAGIGTVVNGA